MPGDAWRRPRETSCVPPAPSRRIALGVATVLVLALAASCGDDGRALSDPSPEQTTTTLPPTTATTTMAGGDTTGVDAGSESGVTATTLPVDPLRLTSPDIPEAGEIPDNYTCWGRDQSPPLQWGPIPAGTVELALVVRDLDAGGFVHWVVAGVDPAVDGLVAGRAPAGAVQALNDFGRPGWSGPCPPDGVHNYEFRVYALAQPSGVTRGMPGADAATRVESTPARMSAVLSGSASPT